MAAKKAGSVTSRIIEATALLCNAIQEAREWDELENAEIILCEYRDAWLVAGREAKLPGVKHNCLSTVDVTEGVREIIKDALERL
jgi:hypothetical protein